MKTPIPRLNETPVELKQLLDTEPEVRKHQRLHALYLLQTQQARTRRQVARLLGVSRNTVGRWLAAYAAGGVARLLTIAKAPGKTPLVPPAVRQALTQRLAQPEGFASDKAIWPWRPHDYGLAIA
jgi:transposase